MPILTVLLLGGAGGVLLDRLKVRINRRTAKQKALPVLPLQSATLAPPVAIEAVHAKGKKSMMSAIEAEAAHTFQSDRL